MMGAARKCMTPGEGHPQLGHAKRRDGLGPGPGAYATGECGGKSFSTATATRLLIEPDAAPAGGLRKKLHAFLLWLMFQEHNVLNTQDSSSKRETVSVGIRVD